MLPRQLAGENKGKMIVCVFSSQNYISISKICNPVFLLFSEKVTVCLVFSEKYDKNPECDENPKRLLS